MCRKYRDIFAGQPEVKKEERLIFTLAPKNTLQTYVVVLFNEKHLIPMYTEGKKSQKHRFVNFLETNFCF